MANYYYYYFLNPLLRQREIMPSKTLMNGKKEDFGHGFVATS